MASTGNRMDELESELMDLYKALDARDSLIAEMENKIEKSTSQNENLNNTGATVSDVEEYRNQAMNYKDAVIETQAQLALSKSENETLLNDKHQLESQVNAQNSLLESLKERLENAENASQEAVKKQRSVSGEQYKLELENRRLASIVEELEENEEDLVSEIEKMANEQHTLEAKNKELRIENEDLQNKMLDETKTNACLESEMSAIKEDFRKEKNNVQKLQGELQKAQEKYQNEMTNVIGDLTNERKKNSVLDAKAALSIGAKKQKESDMELLKLQRELKNLREKYNQCVLDKEQSEADLESACRALEEIRRDHEKKQLELSIQTRSSMKIMEEKIASSLKNEKGIRTLYCDLEQKLDDLRQQLSRSEERNSWYEEKHGLSDAVKYQKKLEADIRRRDLDMKQLTIQIGEREDKCKLLLKACELLKIKAGLPDDFEFEDSELKNEISSEENCLRSQNNELLRQIDMLEEDRLRCLKILRENAAQIGENGVKYLGLTLEQTIQVTEFASNLRSGNVQLPMNNRSMELTSQLATMRNERKSDEVTIERLERELKELKSVNSIDKKQSDSEITVMRHMLEDIQKQNIQLREKLQFYSPTLESKESDATISPFLQRRIEDIIGEPLVNTSDKARVQFICLVKEYDKVEQELSILRASIQRWSNAEKQKRESSSVSNDNFPVDISGAVSPPKKLVNFDGKIILGDQEKIFYAEESSESRQKTPVKREKALFFTKEIAATDLRETLASKIISYLESTHDWQQRNIDLKRQVDEVLLQKQKIEVELCLVRVLDHVANQCDDISETRCPDQASIQKENNLKAECCDCTMREKKANDLQKDLDAAHDAYKLSEEKLAKCEQNIDLMQRKLLENESSQKNKNHFVGQSTIKHFKILLEEKNKIIEKYRRRSLESLSVTCANYNSYDQKNPLDRHDRFQTDGHKSDKEFSMVTSLVDQLNETTKLVQEKENIIRQVEGRLRESEESWHRNEARRKEAVQEITRMKAEFASLISHQEEARAMSREIEVRTTTKQIEELQKQLDSKEIKMSQLKLSIQKIKDLQKGDREESNKAIQVLEKEMEKAKTALVATKRAKERCEKTLSMTKNQTTDAFKDIDRLQNEISKLRNEAVAAKREKALAIKRASRAVTKLKEVQDLRKDEKNRFDKYVERHFFGRKQDAFRDESEKYNGTREGDCRKIICNKTIKTITNKSSLCNTSGLSTIDTKGIQVRLPSEELLALRNSCKVLEEENLRLRRIQKFEIGKLKQLDT